MQSTVTSQAPATTTTNATWRALLDGLRSNGKLVVGLVIVGFFILMALVGPLITPYDPNELTDELFAPPSAQHWLGTTQRGYDTFAQLVAGARVSLLSGFASAVGATILSVLIGLAAGYFGGTTDDVLSLIINIFLVLPGLPLAIVIASFFPFKGAVTIVIVLIVTSWPWGARVLRAQTLSLRRREYVEAARVIGERPWRIILSEILPNEIAIVASSFVGTFVFTTLAQVALEFLGLGDVAVASWGVMLFWAQADNALLTGGWWLFVPPGLCVAILGAGLSFINYGIDELANPSLRGERKLSKRKATT